MEQGKLRTKPVLLVIILFNLGLSVAVVFLMRHAQNLLHDDIRINLVEVATQNKDAISSRLQLNLKSLALAAERLTQQLNRQEAVNFRELQQKIAHQGRGDTNLFVADTEGQIYTSQNTIVNIPGRKYFRLALDGIPNISGRLTSRQNGEEVFVMSVPLYRNETIIGTLQKLYTAQEMYALCALSLFSDKGYMYVVNSEGYVIMHSAHEGCYQKSDNFFRDLQDISNSKASDTIQADIQARRSGFIEIDVEGRKIFSAYTPIEELHDWYLITSVPTSAVASNSNAVISLFYIILFVVLFIFTSIIAYFMWHKHRQRVNLERVAFEDPVTGGNTYNKFVLEASTTLRSAPERPWHIMKFDIDNFKYINKFYGFEFGDRILRHIDQTLQTQLEADEIMARISSDHFVLLLEDASEARVDALLSSIENAETLLYFSAGIFHVADRYEGVNTMVDKAGSAAQLVKGALNRRISYYSDAFEQQALHTETLKRSVKQGLAQGEFVPFYQPKVNVITGELVGGEALVRWHTQDDRYVNPGEFIPMCEQTGLIVEVDMVVYESVLRFLRSLLDRGVECVPISVNFSRLHLQDKDFISKIIQKLHEYDVPAYLIEVELTESALFDNLELIYEFTRKLRSHGLLIAMDDFGTGYSSLTMLREIPIDILKIDKGFLAETTDNSRRDIIFTAIADMARKLRITVVVEGVEDIENVELMKECGCFIAQGYFFARPMSEEAFMQMMISSQS